MFYIKKLVMHGFKSFPKKTELPFTHGINVILGPNGSGKSNISDALCFVLGRLSIKSMRAAKARNLIFLGTKSVAPSRDAMVEIIFNNSDKVFSIEGSEVSVKRIVRRNGQSIYKINNHTKTRQEVLSLLAQAGIDPNGFNIILQGEIQNFVRMHAEERRKIIEEVSGISIYESRKEKSLKELTKTEDRLKEVLSILRERTAYLNNLEKERQQALRYKKLKKDVKVFKASIISQDLTKKKKETEKLILEIGKKFKEVEKIKNLILKSETITKGFESQINSINDTIQKSTGLEQEKLNHEIANLRADLAGLGVKLDNSEKKISELENQKKDLRETIRDNDVSVKELQEESPTLANKAKEIEKKKQELEELEEQRKKFYTIKSELKSIRERISDKENVLQTYINESEFLLKEIKNRSIELFDTKSNPEKLEGLKLALADKRTLLARVNKREIELEKLSSANEYEVENHHKLMEKISKIDVCPICKSKITQGHVHSIHEEHSPRIDSLSKQIESADSELSEIYNKREILMKDIEEISFEISKRESDLMKLTNINEKKNKIKDSHEKIEDLKKEILILEKKKSTLEKNFDISSNVEQKYETVRIEVQEISVRSKENISSEISFKQRELERSKILLKQLIREEKDLNEEVEEFKTSLKKKEELLERKKKQDEELSMKFQKMISEREKFQNKIRENDSEISTRKNQVYNVEQEINNFKIEKAKVDAEQENLETEMLEFEGVEVIKVNKEKLIQRLNKAEDLLSRIGSVNLRSLEVYDSIKKEYELVKDKVEIISKEKESVLRIIKEIDIKKKKAFLHTLGELNEVFARNFSQLSTKGQVSLDLENRKDPFEGGVNIIVKVGHGKYFDVKSLSGGEQTIVALSLIFAIQEFKPYYFYLLDEIDAALDKRNSERLAGLLRKYMKKGQYIVISHNDEVITNATNLYGISMHDGISKVISLEV